MFCRFNVDIWIMSVVYDHFASTKKLIKNLNNRLATLVFNFENNHLSGSPLKTSVYTLCSTFKIVSLIYDNLNIYL